LQAVDARESVNIDRWFDGRDLPKKAYFQIEKETSILKTCSDILCLSQKSYDSTGSINDLTLSGLFSHFLHVLLHLQYYFVIKNQLL